MNEKSFHVWKSQKELMRLTLTPKERTAQEERTKKRIGFLADCKALARQSAACEEHTRLQLPVCPKSVPFIHGMLIE
jgi:hypothetical protein